MTRSTMPSNRVEFGLIAWLEQTRVILPLKGVECRFDVCGELLEVEIDQIYHQNNSAPLDCQYSFPLPGDAAVHRCEMHVNGRVIRAKVEEERTARQIYEAKKAAGHRAALVEMERGNLFTLSMGNVQPGDVVVIRLAYFQTLTRLGDWTSFQVPFCPGVRYIPGKPLLRAPSGRGIADDTDQVPDASRISPPRMERLHPDAAYLFIQGNIHQTLLQLKEVVSVSHPIIVRDGSEGSTVALADNAAVPDCDFVLRWTEADATGVAPCGWVSQDQGESFALVRMAAPRDVSPEDAEGQDIYFLVDRSGSMEGMKWTKAVQAFRAFLKQLGPKDRVWATFFETSYSDLAEKLLTAEELLADSGVAKLEKLGAGGGTELLPALEHVLAEVSKHSVNRNTSLLLITDGQVGNEAEVIRCAGSHHGLRIHTFGIDMAVNDAFLKDLATRHRGTCHLVAPQDDIPEVVARLGLRLRRPVLTNLEVAEGWRISGDAPQDLHAGEVVTISLRTAGHPAEVGLSGRLPGGVAWQKQIPLEACAVSALRLLWARRQISFHLARGESANALQLAKENNLICEGAAFVAWDDAEKVAVADTEHAVYQPSMRLMESLPAYAMGTVIKGRVASSRAPETAWCCLRASDTEEEASPERLSLRLFQRRPSRTLMGRFLDSLFMRHEEAFDLAEPIDSDRLQSLLARVEDRLLKFVPKARLREFMEALCEWLAQDLLQTGAKTEALSQFVDELAALKNDRAAIVGALVGWVGRSVSGSEPADEHLRAVIKEIDRIARPGTKS